MTQLSQLAIVIFQILLTFSLCLIVFLNCCLFVLYLGCYSYFRVDCKKNIHFKMWYLKVFLKCEICAQVKEKKSCNVRSESLVFHCFSALAGVLSVFVQFSVHWYLLHVLFFGLFYFLTYFKHLSISMPKVPALFLMAL